LQYHQGIRSSLYTEVKSIEEAGCAFARRCRIEDNP
jgi:hypothetical protein